MKGKRGKARKRMRHGEKGSEREIKKEKRKGRNIPVEARILV